MKVVQFETLSEVLAMTVSSLKGASGIAVRKYSVVFFKFSQKRELFGEKVASFVEFSKKDSSVVRIEPRTSKFESNPDLNYYEILSFR